MSRRGTTRKHRSQWQVQPELGAIERAKHDLIHMPFSSWCFSYVAGRGADDSHRKSCGCTGLPRIECDFIFLTNRVHCKSWIDHIEHCRPRAPGDCSRSLFGSRNRVLGSICPGHVSRVSEIRGEGDFFRADQEVTVTLVPKVVQARRKQDT